MYRLPRRTSELTHTTTRNTRRLTAAAIEILIPVAIIRSAATHTGHFGSNTSAIAEAIGLTMRRKCCAKLLMSRSPHVAAESCTAATRRATRFRALPDFQFFSMSLPVCSYFAPSSLISFFMSTTNEYSYSGHCFPAWHYHGRHSTRSTGILPVGRPGVSPGRLLLQQSRRSESVPWQARCPPAHSQDGCAPMTCAPNSRR
jgi:hypothetical protein